MNYRIFLLFSTIYFEHSVFKRVNRIICESSRSSRIIRLLSTDDDLSSISPLIDIRNYLFEHCFATPIELIPANRNKPVPFSSFGASIDVIHGNISAPNSYRYLFESSQENKVLLLLNSYVDFDGQQNQFLLLDIFQWYWNQGILNVYIAFCTNGTSLRLFTFNPFNRNASLHLVEVIEEDSNISDLWTDKVSDVNGYPLNITMYPDDVRANEKTIWDRSPAIAMYGGVDGNVAALMEKR